MEEIFEKVADLIADKVADRLSGKFGQDKDSLDEQKQGVELYTAKQVCDMLHMSKSKLYRHQKDGYIKPTQYVGRTPLYSKETIEDYLSIFRYENR